MKQRFLSLSRQLPIALAILFASCTEIVDIELDSTYTRLVVYGEVTSDTMQHQVRLTTSSDYFSNKPSPTVSGAQVELEFDDELMLLVENDSIPGLYQTAMAFAGVPGKTYKLHLSQLDVNSDGISEAYHSSSTMPGGLRLDSIVLSYFTSPFATGYQVFMYGLDPPTREWYNYKIWRNSDLLTDTLIKFAVQPDDFYNGSYIFGLPAGFLSDDDPREALQAGDTVTLEINSIDQAYYNFVVDAQLEIIGNNPLFSGPAANVSTNIDNGGLGVFSAYFIQRISVINPLPQEEGDAGN